MMSAPVIGGVQICQSCADKHKDHDPIVESTKTMLHKCLEILEARGAYNTNGLSYKDYMVHGAQSATENCIVPLLRIYANRSVDALCDHINYVALGGNYFLAGCPPSKITIPTVDSYLNQSLSQHETIPTPTMPIEEQRGFVSKLTGDVE